jgi:hypothetical protein
MRLRTLWIGAAVIAAACGTQSANEAQQEAAEQRAENDNITVAGCLQPGEQGLADNSAGARTAEDVDRFMLTNATITAAGSSAEAGAATPLYVLEGKTDELRQHLGQQVEVSGEIDRNLLGKPETDSSGSPASQRIEVESVRMVAANCSR